MKRIIPYILILSIVLAIFAPFFSVQAQDATKKCLGADNFITSDTTEADCTDSGGRWLTNAEISGAITASRQRDPTKKFCFGSDGFATSDTTEADCIKVNGNTWRTAADQATAAATAKPNSDSDLYQKLDNCGIGGLGGTIVGCVEVVVYVLFVTAPSYLLAIAANVFNFAAALSLSSAMYEIDFIQKIWTIVRDFANIFFILILLYAAFEIILGMGHGGGKKIVATVILIALVVNFSLFFTKIIIDASNVVALIFYNRIDTSNVASYDRISDETKTGVPEKDMAGALVSRFNVNQFFTTDTFTALGKVNVEGQQVSVGSNGGVNAFLLISTMILYGIIILALTYAFFVAGMSFLGRMLNLMMLLILSPLAFVTYSVPSLAHLNTIGFDSWLKKLMESSFVAAIFMFTIYIASEVLRADIFKSAADATATSQSFVSILIMIFMPAILIVILLLKGASYAKKASGEFTGAVINTAKVATGLAIGGAALGTAALARNTVGSTAKYVQNKNAREKALDLKTSLKEVVPKGWNKANPFAWAGAGVKTLGVGRNFATAGAAQGLHKVGIGAKMKDADESYGHKTHAAHILDAKMQSEFGHQYGKDAKYKDLSEHDQDIVKGEIEKDEMSKFIYGKLFKDLEAPSAQRIKDLHTAGNKAIDDGHGKTLGFGTSLADVKDSTGNQKFDSSGNPIVGEKFKSDYLTGMASAPAALGEFVQALRKGSYDVRNLPDMAAKSKGMSKLTVGILAATAAGVRLGLKKGGGIEYGKPQKDALKDIANTVTEALKNVKISVGESGGGGHGGGDSHAKEVKSVGH